MTRSITIELSDELEAWIEQKRRARGLVLLEEAIEDVLEGAMLWERVPKVPDDPNELEAMLLKSLEGEPREITPEEWQRKIEAITGRHAEKERGKSAADVFPVRALPRDVTSRPCCSAPAARSTLKSSFQSRARPEHRLSAECVRSR